MMPNDVDVSKLDISKNLLQMNFMRRTLIAKDSLAIGKGGLFSSVVDPSFPLKSNVVEMLNRRNEAVSKWPDVQVVRGINGKPFSGLRKSYGGFNSYFENLESGLVVSAESVEPENNSNDATKSKKSRDKKLPNQKRKRNSERLGPSAKRARKNHSC